MRTKHILLSTVVPAMLLLGGSAYAASAADVPKVADGLSGVVTSTKGPEAGVWVIAETDSLPTRFIKIVVTDDQGRYLMPQMPKGKYKVWVRGYGLVDSKPVDSAPGAQLNLTASIAPNAAAAAEYYPAAYWLQIMHLPGEKEFPGTGPKGNGVAPTFKNQQQFVSQLKSGCMLCHQQGHEATRKLPNSSVEAWYERLKSARALGDQTVGNHGAGISMSMLNNMTSFGPRGLAVFADWTSRIEKGELPAETPKRPEGVERNIVISVWDWAFGRALHDEITTDRRNPTVNANGLVYALAPTTGNIETLDPVTHQVAEVKLPARPGKEQMNVYPHNPMIDSKGRVWVTDIGQYTLPAALTSEMRPNFCSDGNINKFAKYWPVNGETRDRQLLLFDPATESSVSIPNCFGVHHLAFARDERDSLVFSGDRDAVGWIEAKTFDETKNAEKSQGWCPLVLDTNGDGKITPDRTQWNQPQASRGAGEDITVSGEAPKPDAKKDTRITGGSYGMDTSPVDNAIWLDRLSSYPTAIVRVERGNNAPETCKSEIYQPPVNKDGTYQAFLGRSVSIDSKNIAWVMFNSGHMGAFDRTKCKVTSGPTATGDQCPEGWKLYDVPGPKMAGTNISSDWSYLNWVDVYDTFGLGKDTPMAPGSNSDSLIALNKADGKVHHFTVPYPRGFFARGLDGRIDDPKGGWKGKGLWMAFAMTPAWQQEGGLEGKGPQMVHLQLRSSPLEQ